MRHRRATDRPGADGSAARPEDDPAVMDGEGGALTRACSTQHRASLLGFDWDDPREALAKVREETAEVAALLAPAPGGPVRPRLEEELGDLLFAVVNVARLAGVDPGVALERAARKFAKRFREVRRLAGKRGLPMPGTPLEPLDRLWDEVKRACTLTARGRVQPGCHRPRNPDPIGNGAAGSSFYLRRIWKRGISNPGPGFASNPSMPGPEGHSGPASASVSRAFSSTQS